MTAIWRAREKWSVTKGTKFSTYLYQGVRLECITQCNFNRGHKNVTLYSNVASKANPIEELELMEEIRNCDDSDILIEHFINNRSIKEIAGLKGVCRETIRQKLKRNLSKLKRRLSESV